MKKISKLICLILSLILILAFACSCKETEVVPKSEQVLQAIMQVEKEIDGYKLLYHDSLNDVQVPNSYFSVKYDKYGFERKTKHSKIGITRFKDIKTKEVSVSSIIEKSPAGAKLKQIFDEKGVGYYYENENSFGEYISVVSFDDRIFIVFSGSNA